MDVDSPPPLDPEALMRQLQFSHYVNVVGFSAMVYDIMITIAEEHDLYWQLRWSRGVLLFFSVRYPAVIEGASWLLTSTLASRENVCICMQYFNLWATLASFIPMQSILVLRTVALWDNRRLIKYLLIFGAIVANVAMFTWVILSRISSSFKVPSNLPSTVFRGCAAVEAMNIALPAQALWAAVIAFDSVILSLTVMIAVKTSRSFRTPLLTILIRDGLMHNVVLLVLGLINFYSVFNPGTLMFVTRASYSIFGSRILLNMCGALRPRGASIGVVTLSEMFPAERIDSEVVADDESAPWDSNSP